MIEIFTTTTTFLSSDFVGRFSEEKLAAALLKIGKETGVEFDRQKSSVSISGHWNDLLKAQKSLANFFDTESFQNVARNEQEFDPPQIEFEGFENQKPREKRPIISAVEADGKPGRKPIQNSLHQAKVPEPVVVYQYKKNRIVNEDLLKPSHILQAFDMGGPGPKPSSNQNHKKETHHTPEKKQDNGQISAISANNESSKIQEDNTLDEADDNFDTYDDVPAEMDESDVAGENADKKSTDKECTNNKEIKSETLKDSTDHELKNEDDLKKEDEQTNEDEKKNEEEEEDTSMNRRKRSKRKSKPMRYVQFGSLPEEKKSKKKKVVPKKKKVAKPKLTEDKEEEGEFNCTVCDYHGYKKSNLREHMKRKHRNKFSCEICHKQFGRNKDLNRHKHVHADPAYFCEVCSKFYKTKKVYESHILTHTENYVKPSFSCQLCPKTFSSKYVLAGHIKTEHLGMKKAYMCPTCGRSFTQKNSYIMHANVHAGIKPYVCDVCGKAFTYDKSLREHKFMHDNIRRFQCHVCSKTFRQTTSLRIHMKVHKDSKDYICTSCGKGFTQKQALLRHERIHSGDKPYVCKLCGRSFSDYSIIRRHMMLLHKKASNDWRGDIVSHVKKKKDYYIEGGPGHHVRQLTSTENEIHGLPDPNLKPVVKSTPNTETTPRKGRKAQQPMPTEQQQVFEQFDFSPSSIQDLSQSHAAMLSPLYHSGVGGQGMPLVTGTDTSRPSNISHSPTNLPINYTLSATYSGSNHDNSSQGPIQDTNMNDGPGSYNNSHRNHPRQWFNPSSGISTIPTSSNLQNQMRGPFPGLPPDTTHPPLLHAWPYGGYGPYSSNPPQFPHNPQNPL